MKKSRKVLLLVLFLFCFTSMGVEANSNLQRLSGNNRIDTSIEVSKKAYSRADTVILTGYHGQVDSLSGTILAQFKSAPMIYVGTNREKLDDKILKELQRLGAKNVYILGGEAAISKEVEESLSNYEVTRITGKKREVTAINIAEEVMGESISEVFLTLGYDNYADALAIGPVSGRDKKPIFLTKTNKLPDETKNALKEFAVRKVTIVGGETVVSSSVANELKAMGIAVERIFGSNRAETSIKIAKTYNKNPNGYVIANGRNFPDAVIGGYLAAKENASILLSEDNIIDINSLDYIASNKKKSYVLGGESVIFKGVFEDINSILNENVIIKDEKTDVSGSSEFKDVVERVYYRDGKAFRRQIIRTASKDIERVFIEGDRVAGQTHKISVETSKSSENLYRFYEKELSKNQWTLIQDYGEKNTANWIPKRKGEYVYRIDIKSKNSKRDRDISQLGPIKIQASIPAELKSLDISGTEEAKASQRIIANASGVNGVLYQFFIKNKSTGKTDIIKDYGEENIVDWTPDEEGSYEYGVNVKDKKSWEDKEDSMTKTVEIKPLKPATIESIEISGSNRAKTKHTISAKANSTNGALYQFYIREEKVGRWIMIQDYSSKNSVEWTPENIGEYQYLVAVKDKKSDKKRDNSASTGFTINPPVTYTISNYTDTLEQALDKQMDRNTISKNGKWVKASRTEIKRYLDPNNFLQFKPKTSDQHIISVEVTAGTLNVRSEPNATSKIVSSVSGGNVFVVLEQRGNWFKINLDDKEGWISGDFAKYTNVVPQDMYLFMDLRGQYGATAAELNIELKGKGILEGTGAAFIEASKKHNVNELYLVTHALHETGNGNSALARGIMVDTVDGKPVEPKRVYNMYGIQAFDKTAAKSGSEYGYKMGWFTPEIAVREGAKWISENYINSSRYDQNTLYKMKFNAFVTWHQYATDVGWASKQTNRIYKLVQNCKDNRNTRVRFDIPQYK